MTQINKDTFLYYFLQETGGLHDPRHFNIIIEKLKEWLPDDVGFPKTGYSVDDYELGQREYKNFLMENLK